MLPSDLRHAAVSLGRTPAFTATAILVLALGIGATTAVFSLVYGALLRPLPLADPDRLVRLWSSNEARSVPFFSVSPQDYLDWRARAWRVEAMAAYERQTPIAIRGEAEQVSATRVTPEVFPLLGVPAALGRTFATAEAHEAVISHGLWQRRFGANPNVLGHTVALDDVVWTIVGVMPATFAIPNAPTDVWLPLRLRHDDQRRSARTLRVLGRLRADATVDAARQELVAIAATLDHERPASNRGWSATATPLVETVVSPDFRQSLLLLAGAIAFVLLMACANVSGLLLARATARRREMAVRMALGASRAALLRLLLVESLVLAGAAGVAGVLLALWGVDALKALGADSLPRLDEVAMNMPVLTFAMVVTALTAGVFGLAPALHASREMADALRTRDGAADARASRSRHVLIVAEVALAIVLLVGAGLLIRSFLRLQQRELGFTPAAVLVAGTAAPAASDTRASLTAMNDAIVARLSSLPGVLAVAGGSSLPFVGPNSGDVFEIDGQTVLDGQAPDADYRVVTTGYFDTLGIPILQGRAFTSADGAPVPAAILSAAAVRRYWPGREALGARIRIGRDAPWMTVVGIVGDVRYQALADPGDAVRPMLYLPHTQRPTLPLTFALRASVLPETLTDAVRTTIREQAPDVPITQVQTMAAVLAQARGPQRFAAIVLAAFAWMAVILAAAGLYGLLAYLVSRRTKEIGVRMALGATTLAVVRLTAGHGVLIAAIGVALGLTASWAMAGWLRGILFNVSATDPATYAIVTIGFLTITALASYLPARRAVRINPVEALRTE